MKLLVSTHKSVIDFARERYGIQESVSHLSHRDIRKLPLNTQIFGHLPIPLVGVICAQAHLRYYHLIIPNITKFGMDYTHLYHHAYFQRFHVEELELWPFPTETQSSPVRSAA